MFRSHLCIAFEPLAMNLYEFLKLNDFTGVSLGLIRRFAQQILVSLNFIKVRIRLQAVACQCCMRVVARSKRPEQMQACCRVGSGCAEKLRPHLEPAPQPFWLSEYGSAASLYIPPQRGSTPYPPTSSALCCPAAVGGSWCAIGVDGWYASCVGIEAAPSPYRLFLINALPSHTSRLPHYSSPSTLPRRT